MLKLDAERIPLLACDNAGRPQMRRKGRLQVGAGADIVVFDLSTVGDQATYSEPARTSTGFSEVIVGGTRLISGGVLDTTVLPGQPVRRPMSPAQSSAAPP